MRDDAPGVTAPGDSKRSSEEDERPAPRRPRSAAAAEERGVLSSLPSARPQRPSARRSAARRTKASTTEATAQAPQPPAASTAAAGAEQAPQASGANGRSRKGAARRKARATAEHRERTPLAQAEPAIPRQGFEAESEIEPGVPVAPPSGPDLAVAVAELVGDLAQAGLTRGGRLLKDALGRLPGV
jgi:hypothetical protein